MHLTDPLDHPGADLLAAYIDRGLSPVQQSEIESHLTWCRDCRLVVSETATDLAVRRWRYLTVAGLGTAAAAAAAVIAVLWIGPGIETEAGDPLTRTPATGEGAVPVIQVVSGPESVSLNDGPLSFSWASIGPGIRYRFSLSALDGTEIWGGSLVDTVTTLPADIRIEAGETYVWFVDALLPDGRSATTGLRRITIEP